MDKASIRKYIGIGVLIIVIGIVAYANKESLKNIIQLLSMGNYTDGSIDRTYSDNDIKALE